MRLSVSNTSTASLSPFTKLNTPAGKPASVNKSAIIKLALGVFSEGLRTKVLPVASAIGIIHSGTIMGKLKGVMPATTPNGWCML